MSVVRGRADVRITGIDENIAIFRQSESRVSNVNAPLGLTPHTLAPLKRPFYYCSPNNQCTARRG
jgi:hypothetical protein